MRNLGSIYFTMATISSLPSARTKIIVCCDGTANSEYMGNIVSPLTNVSRLSRCIVPQATEGNPQLVLYLPGVGTDSWNPVLDSTWQGLRDRSRNVWRQAAGKG